MNIFNNLNLEGTKKLLTNYAWLIKQIGASYNPGAKRNDSVS